jgi:hypothetical protein
MSRDRYVDEHTDYMTDLGERAVACSGWVWHTGTRAFPKGADPASADPVRTVSFPWSEPGHATRVNAVIGHDDPHQRLAIVATSTLVPDFDDWATLGNLLICVRVAWRDAIATTSYSEYEDGRDPWRVSVHVREGRRYTVLHFPGRTEAEALVAALEEADPRRRRYLAPSPTLDDYDEY